MLFGYAIKNGKTGNVDKGVVYGEDYSCAAEELDRFYIDVKKSDIKNIFLVALTNANCGEWDVYEIPDEEDEEDFSENKHENDFFEIPFTAEANIDVDTDRIDELFNRLGRVH